MIAITKIPILANIDKKQIEELIEKKNLFQKKYVKGTTIHQQQEKCETLDIVIEGNLVAYSLSDNGSAVTMFEFKTNSMIGANLLFSDQSIYPLNIYSETPCTLLHITKQGVADLLHEHPFVIEYIKSLSLNSQNMNRKISILTQKTLRENLLDYFQTLVNDQKSKEILLPMSKKQLADYLGVQRPSLFREMKRLKNEGIIQVENRRITLNK